jgi:RsiW-degrading membrane proteinase PrsW (M82 family)
LNILLLVLLSFLAGFLPMICWALILWWFDRFEKEPFSLLALSFFWGVIPGMGISLLMEFLLQAPPGSTSPAPVSGLHFSRNEILIPVLEEGVKLIGLIGIFLAARDEIDGLLDGMIYGAVIGFGFAATENTLFFLSSRNLSDFILLAFLRSVIFGSAHAMFSSLTGLGLALARYARNGLLAVGWMIGGLGLAVAFHWLHNLGTRQPAENPWLFVVSIGTSLIGIVFVVLLLMSALLREKQSIRTFLYRDVQEGRLTAAQWKMATSIRNRWSAEWSLLKKMDVRGYRRISRFCSVCAELALKEKQRYLFGPNRSLDLHIQILQDALLLQTPEEITP